MDCFLFLLHGWNDSTIQSPESFQHQDPTTADTYEDTTPKSQPHDDGELTSIPSAAPPSELSPEEADNSTDNSENITFPPSEFDQPTGSGMLPSFTEEVAYPMPPAEKPKEAKPTEENKKIMPEVNDVTSESKKIYKQLQANERVKLCVRLQ